MQLHAYSNAAKVDRQSANALHVAYAAGGPVDLGMAVDIAKVTAVSSLRRCRIAV
jgi:hypothetical protein